MQFRMIGYNSIPVVSVYLAVTVLILILCLIFRNKQPLKSRGFVPLITLGLFISTFSIMISRLLFGRQWQFTYGCYLSYFVVTPSEMTSYFVIVLHGMRYLLIINLNKMKGHFCSKRNTSKITLRAKILTTITRPWFTLLMVILFVLFVEISYLIVLGVFRFNCENQNLGIFALPVLGIVALIILISGGCVLLADVISNIRLKCNPVKYFTVDAYWYRLEVVMVFGTGIILVLLLAIRMVVPPLVDSILFTCFFFIFEGLLTIFPLILTIVREIKNFKKTVNEEEHDETIEQTLLSEETRKLFIEHVKKEWSIENVMIWVIQLIETYMIG